MFALRAKMKEKGIDAKAQKSYNINLEKSARKYLYKYSSFFIVGAGIHPDELSAIWVENNIYKGFGYFNPELTEATPVNLREVIKSDEDDSEAQKIIRSHMRKLKNYKLLTY